MSTQPMQFKYTKGSVQFTEGVEIENAQMTIPLYLPIKTHKEENIVAN